MFNGFDLSTISDLYVGSTQASAIYYGSNLIWSHGAHDYSKDFLTFEAIESGTFTFTDSVNSNSVLYSVDGGQVWQTLQSGSSTPTVNAGDKIMWQCFHPSIASTVNGMGTFSSTGTFNITGNIMSMYDGDRFATATTTTLPNAYQFARLFYQNKVVDASNFILPATTLSDRCYNSMFHDCTLLTTAPNILPATTLAWACYIAMFNNCTSLTIAPELPATTLATSCYASMFYDCKSLEKAPELPATTLVQSCYNSMFFQASSLNWIKCYATSGINTNNSTTNWVYRTAWSGDFYKDSSATWPGGNSGISWYWTTHDIT